MTSMNKAASPVLLGALGVFCFLALWEAGSAAVDAREALPPVQDVVTALLALAGTGAFWQDLGATLGVSLAGWAIAAVLGVTLGILIGTSRWIRAVTRIPLEFLRPIPAIVILPLAMLVLGPTTEMGVFLVVFGVLLPITAQTVAGVEAVDPVMRNTARSFGLGRTEILVRVVLPGASPFIGTAMRVAAPVTLVMTVVAGMLGGSPGLGNSLSVAQLTGRTEDIFAYVLVLGILGLLVQALSNRAERRILHWHTSFRKVSP
ncbi:ABC transporter permease [Arthrobacter woluwensis]|uniref:ABC transporter permease n=1 Tax=Arthrobacter woluwensis TaxID=156980 RepID=UPI003806FFCA